MNLQLNSQTYTSVTIWQGDPGLEIEVRINGFPTIKSAIEFGCNHTKKLKHEPNADYLILLDSTGCSHKVEQEQVFVHKLNPESRGKLVVNAHDFTPIDVKIKNFSNINGLDRGFECLAYGVLDGGFNRIEF